MKLLICGVGGRMGREVAKMALLTEQLAPKTARVKQHLLDKHYFRKHGKNAYYGQK